VDSVARLVSTAAMVLVGTSWAIWALVWLVTGVHTVFMGPQTRTRGRFVSAALAGAVVVAVAARVIPHRRWHALVVSQPWLRITGMVVLVASLLFTLWARRVLGLMWSSAPQVKAGHELRTDGPYAITRHPIYTGMLGMFLGTSLAEGLGPYAVLFPAGILVFLIKIRSEERLMASAFPEQYPRYRRQVPQLVPGLRWNRSTTDR